MSKVYGTRRSKSGHGGCRVSGTGFRDKVQDLRSIEGSCLKRMLWNTILLAPDLC